MILMILFWTTLLLHNIKFSLQGDQAFTLNVLHICNLDSAIAANKDSVGGMPRIIHFVKENRNLDIPMLFFDNGDIFTGTIWYHVHNVTALTPFYEILKPDAICLGEQELFDGVDMLKRFMDEVKVPYLCCNCDVSRERRLSDLIVPHIKVNITGKQIGIIGYIRQDADLLTPYFANFTLGDVVEAVTKEVRKLEEENVNMIIVLAHAGLAVDMKVAEEVEGIDLLIGGHSATFLYTGSVPKYMQNETKVGDYPLLIKSKAGKEVPYIHAYEEGWLVGKLTITFDEDGVITNMSGNPVLMDKTITEDAQAMTILTGLKAAVDTHKATVLGTCRVDLNSDCLRKECNIANLMADSWIEHLAQKHTGKDGWTETPIALLPANSFDPKVIRWGSGVDRNVTIGHILDVSPFDDYLFETKINGSMLREAVEHSVTDDSLGFGKFLHYSGVRVRINYNKKGKERIESIRVRCGKCDVPSYSDLKDSEVYSLVLQDYLAHGALNFKMLDREDTRTAVGVRQNKVLQDYIKKYKVITPQEDERIVIIAGSETRSDDAVTRKSDGNGKYLANNEMVILISTLAALHF